MYALSALGTGSPSLIKDIKRDFLYFKEEGLVRGSSEIGGVPKVRQCIRLKPVLISVIVHRGYFWGGDHTACQYIELRLCILGEHVRIEQACNSSARGVACHKQRA